MKASKNNGNNTTSQKMDGQQISQALSAEEHPPIVSFSGFAKLSGIGEYHLRHLIANTDFPRMHLASTILIHVETAMNWLKEQCRACSRLIALEPETGKE